MSPDNSEDRQLVERIANGDTTALGLLARRHQDKALGIAYRIVGKWDVAEDVVQEAFLRVYKGAAEYKGKSSFSTWLYRIVVNLSLDELRKRKKAGISTEQLSVEIPADRNKDKLETEEIASAVQQAVHDLPERQRIAVVLHRFEGLSHDRISETTGWSKSAVESLLVRAYASLREKLKKYGGKNK